MLVILRRVSSIYTSGHFNKTRDLRAKSAFTRFNSIIRYINNQRHATLSTKHTPTRNRIPKPNPHDSHKMTRYNRNLKRNTLMNITNPTVASESASGHVPQAQVCTQTRLNPLTFWTSCFFLHLTGLHTLRRSGSSSRFMHFSSIAWIQTHRDHRHARTYLRVRCEQRCPSWSRSYDFGCHCQGEFPYIFGF
jgi:hypothetical protein